MTKTRVPLLLSVLISLTIGLGTLDTALSAQPFIQGTPVEQVEEDPEVIALQAQLEQMRRSDDRLLQTVYWALSALLTVGLVLVGYSWFSSGRAYDRDKTALRQKLTGALQEQSAKAEQTLRSHAEEQYQSLSKQSQEAISQSINDVRNELRNTIGQVQDDLKILKHETLELEAARHEDREVFATSLRTYVEMMTIALDIGWDWMVSTDLESIIRSLKLGAVPDGIQAREITALLDGLSAEFSADVEIAKKLLIESRN